MNFCVNCDDPEDIYIYDIGDGGEYVPFRSKVNVLNTDDVNILLEKIFLEKFTVTKMAYFEDGLSRIAIETTDGTIEFYINLYANSLNFYHKDKKEFHRYYFYIR